jgi:hypothetical protein
LFFNAVTIKENTGKKHVSLYAYIILVGLVVSVCIFPPQLVFAKKISDYTVHIMIGLLGMGMVFLLLERTRLMFASFAYCGILCLFLKGNVNQNLQLATSTGTPSITVGHFNLGNTGAGYQELIDEIISANLDIIAVNEFTPNWEFILGQALSDSHPYQAKLVRIDPLGLGFFSKRPIQQIDTLEFYGDHPHLSIRMQMGLRSDVQLVTSYFMPPLTRKTYGDYRVELSKMGQTLSDIPLPLVVTGDYNLSDWSNELREFKFLSGLISSRRDVTPKSSRGVKTWMNFPLDHIFFNDALECTAFETVTDTLGNHLGIKGTYQLRSQPTARK